MYSLVNPLHLSGQLAILASGVFLAVACNGSPTNSQPANADSDVVTLSVANALRPGDAIHIDATLSAPLNAVAPRALIVTAGADTEFVALHPGVCVIEGYEVECGALLFAVAEGRRAEEFRSAISGLGGTFINPINQTIERVGALRTRLGEEVRIRDALRLLDGVIDAHLAFMRYPRGQEPPPFGRGVLATSARTGRSGDGWLQVAEGDRVRVTSTENPHVSIEVVVSRASP